MYAMASVLRILGLFDEVIQIQKITELHERHQSVP